MVNYINNENIENNIFGVELCGIKILKLPVSKEIGVYFYSKLEKKIIYENDILKPNDEIYFVYDYNILKKGKGNYTLEMAGIVQENEYSRVNDFTIYNKFYGIASPEFYYKRKIYIGRSSFYNFTIPNTLNGNNNNSCKENCKVCYNSMCIKCKDNYKLIEDKNICQLEIPNNNYYFDEKYNIYKKCHEYCKSCLQGPKYFNDILEIEDTNCDECIENYYKIENTNNCINKNNIPETYFFDPEKELIFKCFENCRTCSQKQINSTYYSCLSCDENSILYEKSGNCLNCYAKGKYAKHYENECIDFIPEDYYLEDEQNKAISKCYFSCKKCDSGGDSNNHNCIECGENYPYKNKEGTKCLEDCSKEYLYTDIQTKICYNDCKDNIIAERRYNFYNICSNIEEKTNNYDLVGNNFVRKCKKESDYFFNNECYEASLDGSSTIPKLCICNNLFYLNDEIQICIDMDIYPLEHSYLKQNTLECSKCYFKYKGECYSLCPNNTYVDKIIDEINVCSDIINGTYNINIISIYNNYIDYFNKIIKRNDNSNNKDNITKNLRNELMNNKLDVFIENNIIKENKDLLFKENNIIYQLTSTDNQKKNKNNNISTINLGECETKLRQYYNINNNITLLILKIDIFKKGLLIPIIEYEVYNSETKKKLNLTICNYIKINISMPVIIDENNVLKYNSSNDYYNNICYRYTSNYKTDITLKDRRNEYINYNMSLCEYNCKYINYDYNIKKVLCECFIKINFPLISEIEINKDKLLRNFKDIKNILNLNVIKCYKEVFTKEGLIYNIGNYIMSTIILLTFILSVLFKIKGYTNIKNLIFAFIKNKNTKVLDKKKKNNPPKRRKRINMHIMKTNDELKTKSGRNSRSFIIKKNKYTKKKKDINNILKNKIYYNDYELNTLSYQKALKIDKRTYFQYYFSLLKMKHILISTFYTNTDYNSKIIKIIIFLFSFALYLTINALFFEETTLHRIYEDQGKFNFIYQIPYILYSTFITSFINTIIKYLSLTEKIIIEIKAELKKETKTESKKEKKRKNEKNDKNKKENKKESKKGNKKENKPKEIKGKENNKEGKKENKNVIKKISNLLNNLTIKFIIFFILIFLFLVLFWYYLICFCGIYQNTQIYLIKDSLISFGLSLLYPFILNLLPGIFRIPSLKSNNKEFLFKISKIIHIIII